MRTFHKRFASDALRRMGFHYTGDLFFIYKAGHLMKLMCEKREG
jgi:hypothetical protein